MPLMWAHAEYIKLLHSCSEGVAFDRIAIVADRYSQRAGRRDLEIWKPTRQVRAMKRGETLRIQAPARFRLRWTQDEWRTATDTVSTDSRLGIHFVDLAVSSGQSSPVRFTFFWLESVSFPLFQRQRERWEGRDYAVEVR
jgi:glucoamylase